VTNAQGLAEFFELPTESPDGVACEYTIVEISQAGFETDSPASGSYTLIPTDGETLEFVNSTIDDGTGVAGNIDLGCGFAVVGSNVVEPGDQVSFYAYGYQPGTVLVIEANGVTLGTFTVPASGVVTGLVTIPDLAPGAYQLTATGTGTDGGARVMSCPYISIPASTPTTASGTTTGGTTTGGGEVGATTGAGEVGAATGGATATTQPNTGVGAGSVTTLPPTGLPSGVAGAGTATTIPSGVAGNGSTIDPAVAAAIDAANAAITAAQTRGTAGDSDGDGVLDTIETKLGFDPNDPNSKPAADLDTDGDGFPDVVEAMLGYDWKDPNDPLNRGRFGGGASTSRSADVRGERLDNNDGSSLPQRVARTGADHLPFLLALGGGMIVLGTLINSRARRRANR
ncbi:MAG: hypothetical protein KDB86_14280, partial [Actinobacteria bacterium]|nr:hypothetical protein [Actinomycetota bacterium]